jgi:plastocyanin
MPRALRPVLVVAACLGLVAAAAGVATQPAGRRVEIRMRGNSFAPRTPTVTVGDTVEWVNTDIVRHNAVRDSLFDSGELRRGERFAWVPTDTGTIRYQCTIHSRMRGTLRVRARNGS